MHHHSNNHSLNKSKKVAAWGILKKIWPYLWPKSLFAIRLRLILAVACLILSKIILIGVPLFYKKLIDQLSVIDLNPVGSLPVIAILSLILGYGGARLFSAVFNEVRDAIFTPVTQGALRRLALNVFNHLHLLSLRYHITRQTGGLTRSIERGTKSVESLMHFMLIIILPTCIEVLLSAFVLWWLFGWYFCAIMLATIAVYTVFTLRLTQWRTKLVREMNDSDKEAQNKAVESLINFETVKYFCNEDREKDNFEESLIAYEKAAIKNKLSLLALNVGQTVITTFGLIAIMYFAAVNIMNQTMTVGDFAAVTTFLLQLYVPLFNLGFAYREVKIALVNMEDMISLLEEPVDIKDEANSLPLEVSQACVEFKEVSFCYDESRKILNKISFTIPAGKTLAIVGSTGAGKSTIAKLLFRFYDPQEGGIYIDGQDIKQVTQRSLRGAIGVVPQDTVLFNQSIGYNIAYGDTNATQDMIDNAAKGAKIYDFIQTMPDGYDTKVGERGLKLSGGEKQRIAIARALLKNPHIFIFDEATSSLDGNTENDIKKNLDAISRKKTTLIIAHRLSTIVNSDEVIVLDQGKIIQQGNHKQLIAQNGLYRQLWQKQEKENPVVN